MSLIAERAAIDSIVMLVVLPSNRCAAGTSGQDSACTAGADRAAALGQVDPTGQRLLVSARFRTLVVDIVGSRLGYQSQAGEPPGRIRVGNWE